MMEGFLDFLLGDSEDAQLLRDTFVFKVRDLELRVSHQSRHYERCGFLIWIHGPAGGSYAEP